MCIFALLLAGFGKIEGMKNIIKLTLLRVFSLKTFQGMQDTKRSVF